MADTVRIVGKRRKNGCVTAFAYDGKERVGWIGACPGSLEHMDVQKVHVVETHRRRGVGTKLYERIARLTCDAGLKLSSQDWQRSRMSEGFWLKQLAKGRVVQERDRKVLVDTCGTTSLASSGRAVRGMMGRR